MTRVVILPSKRPEEKVTVTFPFQDQLAFGETISGQTVTAVVFSGIDPAPEAILFGAASHVGTNVLQSIQDGLPGVVYQLVAAAAGSGGHIYTKDAKQAIVASPGSFTGPV